MPAQLAAHQQCGLVNAAHQQGLDSLVPLEFDEKRYVIALEQ